MNIRTLVVDDEPHAREGILLRLRDFPEIEVLGECASGNDAVDMINNLKPDLLFLDIQMPGMNGFEVIKSIDAEPMPIIIFVTAYDKYALNAFEFHALDYLLKPINQERFNHTLQAVLKRTHQKNMAAYAEKLKLMMDDYQSVMGNDTDENKNNMLNSKKNFINRLLIKSKENISLITVDDIDWLESAGDYVYVHTNSKKLIFRETLTALENKLDPKIFVRIHRSIIVNLAKVKNLRSNEHGDFDVFLENGVKLKLSRTYRANFQSSIGNQI